MKLPKRVTLNNHNYYYRKLVDGERVSIKIGTIEDHISVIQKKAAEVSLLLELGDDQLALDRISEKFDTKLKKIHTFEKLFDVFIKDRAVNIRPNTLKNYNSCKSNMLDFLADEYKTDLPLTKYNYELAVKHKTYLMAKDIKANGSDKVIKKGMKLSTYAKERSCLNTIFKMAVKLKWIDSNPFTDVEVGKNQEKYRYIFLEDDEIDRLLEACKELDSSDYISQIQIDSIYDIIFTYLYTGYRHDELRYLEWSDISYVQNEISAFSKKMQFVKNGKKQSMTWKPKAKEGFIPINAKLKELLQRRQAKAKSNLVFSKEDGSLLTVDFNIYLKKLLVMANIDKDLTIHGLRHTFGTWLRRRGAPIETIKELMRHKNIKETLIYAKYSKEEGQKAIDLI